MSQTNTKLVKIKTVIGNHHFTRGIKDYRAGLGFDKAYDSWEGSDQWCYERGRLFAAATNGTVPTKYGPGNKRVNPAAIRKFFELTEENAII